MINTDFRVEVTSDWEEGEAEVTGRYTGTGQTISKVLFIKIHDRYQYSFYYYALNNNKVIVMLLYIYIVHSFVGIFCNLKEF